ncbi:hypothetical protein BDB00DRAFT_879665 [Zychaea mexicana]|uniref:uncharacterized protein n=1 Tax=Zychaea mexicana TaxID=64656 RepID=UPI0022FEADF6|nr:uncharacterized protein BDB00DRAFT_879665 [Zychaea mexicana]KAI9474834.1 hypothetical protein BDB00DRAFT_879665 [Zychaea mexicana]
MALARRYEQGQGSKLQVREKITDVVYGLKIEYWEQLPQPTLSTLVELRQSLVNAERHMNVIRHTVGLGVLPQANTAHPATGLAAYHHRNMEAPVHVILRPVQDKAMPQRHRPETIQITQEQLENTLANAMDRMEARLQSSMINQRASGQRCYNCQEEGHHAVDCRKPCRICNSSQHRSNSCPKRVGGSGSRGPQDFQQGYQ